MSESKNSPIQEGTSPALLGEHDAYCVERPMAGWKAIAEHLGISEVTAKRLVARGLPIHRPADGTVFAFPAAINKWIRGADKRNPGKPEGAEAF
ncbi:hypothetical protein [Vulgatibacter incomptus]|uniref:hypothetical protein n=1 Tax=Vulgatibacter incomptus TaxID=1391653 RepID=UPI0012F9BB5E|nr:hypothetical protein [Vulgatibacter incomptus]